VQALISLGQYELALGSAVAATRVARGRYESLKAWYQAAVCCHHLGSPLAVLFFLQQVCSSGWLQEILPSSVSGSHANW
jgi:hypothetical protein